jgi:hypothetical protein
LWYGSFLNLLEEIPTIPLSLNTYGPILGFAIEEIAVTIELLVVKSGAEWSYLSLSTRIQIFQGKSNPTFSSHCTIWTPNEAGNQFS